MKAPLQVIVSPRVSLVAPADDAREPIDDVVTLTANAAASGAGIDVKVGKYLNVVQPILETDVPGGAWPKGANVYLEVFVLENKVTSATREGILVYRGPLMGDSKWPASVPGHLCRLAQKLVARVTAGSTDELGNSLTGAKVRVHYEFSDAPPPSVRLVDREPSEFPGTVRTVTVAAPGAGVQVPYQTVPAKVAHRVRAWRGTLTCGAGVGNRTVSVASDDGANTESQAFSQVTLTATNVAEFDFFPSAPDRAAAVQGVVLSPISPALNLPAGYRHRMSATGILAADAWTSLVFVVEERVAP